VKFPYVSLIILVVALVLAACSSGANSNQKNSTSPPVVSGGASSAARSAMGTGKGASLNGFVPFPAAWNTDISGAPVDSQSDAIIGFIHRQCAINFGGPARHAELERNRRILLHCFP
jgi:hypothetical protein